MPNHCNNQVEFCGSKRDIDSLRELLGGETTSDKKLLFDFNKIIPMPEELALVQAPISIVSQRKYKKIVKDYADRKAAGTLKDYETATFPITQQMSDNYKQRFGFDNWYDWATGTWGTKWSSYDVECMYDSETVLEFCFTTAWCPPRGIFLALKKMFPKVRITWGFSEPGCCLHGTWHFSGGKRKAAK